jgi:hypothetical protein
VLRADTAKLAGWAEQVMADDDPGQRMTRR